MALPGQDRFGYAVSELMQRMQIYGTYVLGVYDYNKVVQGGQYLHQQI